MSTIRERASSAEAIKRANGWLTVFWLLNFPPIIWLYLAVDNETFQRVTILYLALVSIWANVGTHFAGWVAGRTEVKVEAQEADIENAGTVNVTPSKEK